MIAHRPNPFSERGKDCGMGKRVGSAWFLPTLSALCSLLVTIPAFGLMGWLDTYMDEEFHIPQAQAYCR
jgi:hypothetical protein